MEKKIVVSRIQVVEGKEQDYIDLVEPIIKRTVSEPGTLNYAYYRNMYNPSEFLAYEEYAGEKGFDAHCDSDEFRNFQKQVGTLLAKPIDMQSFNG